MECIRGNRKRLSFNENASRHSDDSLANGFYRRHHIRHTMFWRGFDVLRQSFTRANHKRNRGATQSKPHKTTSTNDIDILRSYELNAKQSDNKHKTRRNTFDCDKLTYGFRDITLSTDWVIISEISDKNKSEYRRRR